MAELPEIIQYDQTLLAVDAAMEAHNKLRTPGHALGASEIGKECPREIFYKFRSAYNAKIDAQGLRIFESGYEAEDRFAEKLRLLPYITLITKNPNDPEKQIGGATLLGHFKYYLDGMIQGIVEAPQTWHTWETKCVNDDKFKKFLKIREEKGVKETVSEWDYRYYCQTIIGMYMMNITRNFFTVCTPGMRQWASVRTNENRKLGESLIEKAQNIIFDNFNIPAKCSSKSTSYVCKYCDYLELCHEGHIPNANCKTCRYSKCVDDGQRECTLKQAVIPKEELLLDTCSDHVFNPALMPDGLTFVEHQEHCAVYKKGKLVIANCQRTAFPDITSDIHTILTSAEMFKLQTVENIPDQRNTQQNNGTSQLIK